MTAESTAAATAKIEPVVRRIDEQTRALNLTFEEAQMWGAMTEGMSYEQKMGLINGCKSKCANAGANSR
ncbi:MAG TPA: hypothetical protein VES69_12665 [Pyrinomonadaceae bacterium]|nr:hypothetical protein [Pyrinomonadaceae bacterium]